MSPANDARAAEAEQHMREAFEKWVWTDEARRNDLGDTYNAMFNTHAERSYRTDYLTMPGTPPWWGWRPHQLRGVARGLMSGNTYLAHAVGAGKTATMIRSSRWRHVACSRVPSPCSSCRTRS